MSSFIGSVKWFSNKLGYGFATYKDNDGESHDIFLHHSAITTEGSTYKTLYQGECIQFSLEPSKRQGQMQASNVTGFNGTKLACERKMMISKKYRERTEKGGEEEAQKTQTQERFATRRSEDEWTKVISKKSTSATSNNAS